MELKHTDYPPAGLIDGVIDTLTDGHASNEDFERAALQAIEYLEMFRDLLRRAYVESLDGSHK